MDASTAGAEESMSMDTLGRRIVPRRFRSVEEKRRIVLETRVPGSSTAEIARRHGVNANLLFVWRRQHEHGMLGARTRRAAAVKLLPVKIEPADPAPSQAPVSAYVEIELADGTRIRSFGAVERATLEQVLSLLRR